jgi:hypothetical protein
MKNYQADLERARQIAEQRPADVEAARLLAYELARAGKRQPADPSRPKNNKSPTTY